MVTNPTRIHEDIVQSQALASSVAMSYGVAGRWGSDPALLWLWCRSEATAPIRSLAWELPYAAGVALKKERERERKIPYDIAYMWNLKYGIDEPIYRTETHNHGEQTCGCQEEGGGCGMDWQLGVSRYKLLHLFIYLFIYLLSFYWWPHPRHMEAPRLGVKWGPLPQQQGIRAMSASSTAAHGNTTRSLTH